MYRLSIFITVFLSWCLSAGAATSDLNKHRIFVEEFTTEKCSNCPRVGGFIHDALEKEEFKDNVIVVCHHAGFLTDWLTTSFDSQYLRLYNDATSIYAPAMGVDRVRHSNNSPLWCPLTADDMENAWREALARPAFVSLGISADVDADNANHITVTVEGKKSSETLCDNPVMTIYLVEDNIPAKHQEGSRSGYIHNHVNRAVNATWGDPIEFNGDEYEYTCEFDLDDKWNIDNLQIVAMVSNYNPKDVNDCEVQNAAALPFTDFYTSGIPTITDDGKAESEIYSLSGIKMNPSNLTPGIYIRKSGSKSEKFIVPARALQSGSVSRIRGCLV